MAVGEAGAIVVTDQPRYLKNLDKHIFKPYELKLMKSQNQEFLTHAITQKNPAFTQKDALLIKSK